MTNKPRRIGTRWESVVEGYFNDGGAGVAPIPAKRTGSEDADMSDIRLGEHGEWLLECKDHERITLPAFLKQLQASKVRALVLPFKAAAVVKNRRHNVAEAYAVRRLEDERMLISYVMALEEAIKQMTGEDLSILGWDYSVPVNDLAGDISDGALASPDE